jgi:hypothetical protein
VVPHPHFGGIMTAPPTKAEAERRLGLAPVPIRLGILGAPRADKHTAYFADAFAATTRDDVELCVWSLAPGESIVSDPRIHAERYSMVDRELYDTRLAACDAIVLPFEGHDMLATGTAADAVATGKAALVSSWPFLHEYLGDAGIPYGTTKDEIVATLEALDRAALDRAGAAARALQPHYAPEVAGEQTYHILDRLPLGTA